MKGFLNNKKVPLISPLFHENCFITDFKEKAKLFNSFFAKQYSLIRNTSELPISLTFYNNNRLATVSFSHEDVGKIIQNLNPKKAHGHDNISIRMLKIFCGKTFEGLIFNERFSLLLENNLVSPINWGSNLGILALISYYSLYMKSFNHLMKDLKLGVSS